MILDRIYRLLETYTLTELLEYSDLTEEEVLDFLYEEGLLKLPPEPVG